MNVLMIGNSLTTANNMPDTLAELTGAQVTTLARGGARLAEFANPKTRMGARFHELLQTERFDYIVLQEMSHAPVTSPEAYQRSVQKLCEIIATLSRRDNDPATPPFRVTHPIIFGTWSYSPDCPRLAKLGLTYQQMREAMCESFEQAAVSNAAMLASLCREDLAQASEWPWGADGVHPSKAGSRMAAEAIARIVGV